VLKRRDLEIVFDIDRQGMAAPDRWRRFSSGSIIVG
jgi:hypothetical protein